MIDNDEIQKIVPILKSGGIIIFPTDTIWGIGCNALDKKAVERIYAIKKRSKDKPMPLLIDTYARLLTHVNKVHPKTTALIDYHDRPLTIIYDKAKNLPDNIIADDESIAIRIVKDDFCRALIKAADFPLVATSANYSEQDSPKNFSEIDKDFLKEVDYVVRHRQHEIQLNEPSTIVKVKKDGELVFLRT